ncbi:MAG TPA: hypothetical protein VLS47_05455 [Gallionella sp.]|nr:hypothetical protein [Gallionella sp.]
MMLRTQSEKLFELFCRGNNIRCNPVKVGKKRTPDYDIFLPRRKVVTEVKEITPNPNERAAETALRLKKWAVVSSTPGERIRGKITDASPQIRRRTKRRYPGLIVLFETGLISRHLDPYQVRVAMYGLETIVVAVPRNPNASPYPIDRKFGPRRKMTPEHNTAVSAIGILSAQQNGMPALVIYHNAHAALPLRQELFSRYGVRQFKLAQPSPGAIADWEEI